jgi:MSHA biogenesis protein MshI
MWSILKKLENSNGQIGVYRSPEGLAVASVLASPVHTKPVLSHCVLEPAGADDAMPRAVRQLKDRKLPTVSVLPETAYHMLLVEAPQVPPEELRGAVRWRIKDLIDFHVDDAVIDVFQMPSHGRGGPNQMMYAVAARTKNVRDEVAAAENAGLNLDAIEIVELSLRNIAVRLEEDARGVALLYLGDTGGTLLLLRQGTLYLARHIETGVRTLRDANGLRAELVSGLALEARRSLDYFESHYEQRSIPVLYTCGLEGPDRERLATELGVVVRNLELRELFDNEPELDEEVQRICLPAIGAALRRDTITL